MSTDFHKYLYINRKTSASVFQEDHVEESNLSLNNDKEIYIYQRILLLIQFGGLSCSKLLNYSSHNA